MPRAWHKRNPSRRVSREGPASLAGCRPHCFLARRSDRSGRRIGMAHQKVGPKIAAGTRRRSTRLRDPAMKSISASNSLSTGTVEMVGVDPRSEPGTRRGSPGPRCHGQVHQRETRLKASRAIKAQSHDPDELNHRGTEIDLDPRPLLPRMRPAIWACAPPPQPPIMPVLQAELEHAESASPVSRIEGLSRETTPALIRFSISRREAVSAA